MKLYELSNLSREGEKNKPQWKAQTLLLLAQSPTSQDLSVKGPNLLPAFAVLQDRRIIKPRSQKSVEKEPETKVHRLNCFFLHGKLTINLRPNRDFVFFSEASLFYCDTPASPYPTS